MALQQIQAAVHADPSLESYDPAGLTILEESVTDREASWSLWAVPIIEF